MHFPSMKPPELLAVLERAGYREVRVNGSHRRMECEGRPPITFAFHGRSIAPGMVRKVLMKDAQLTETEILGLL
jgi:predicted RNA binding protein YcfA (HicA-like mRNA interferase family)